MTQTVVYPAILIAISGVVGTALLAAAGSFIGLYKKFVGFVDSHVTNVDTRTGVDYLLTVGEHLVAAEIQTIGTDLSQGKIDALVKDIVGQAKSIAATDGTDAAQKMLQLGEAKINAVVAGLVAKAKAALGA